MAQTLPDCPLLTLEPTFLNPEKAQQLFLSLLHQHDWPESEYEVFGRRFSLPRQQTWHADESIVYSYHNNLLQTRAWTPVLQSLRGQVETATGSRFNAVLVNLYRNGNDYVGWHSDDEKEMGDEPVIASLSLGAERLFSYRERQDMSDDLHNGLFQDQRRTGQVLLPSGSLVMMQAPFQQAWEHAVLKDATETPRINLTFRYVYPPQTR